MAVTNRKACAPGSAVAAIATFEVQKGQKLQFEVITFTLDQGSVSSDPELILYEPSKSWFSAQKGARLEVDDQSRPGLGDFSDVTSHCLPRLKHIFEKSGRYVAEVGTVEGKEVPPIPISFGSCRCKARRTARSDGVRLSMRTAETFRRDGQEASPAPWSRIASSSFLRGAAAGVAYSAGIRVLHEDELNGTPDRALAVKIPAIIKGVLQRPGDVDYYSFQAKLPSRTGPETRL